MKKKSLVPKSFTVGGQNIKVKKSKSINLESTLGHNKHLYNEISIRTEFEGRALPQEQIEHTYFHELVHSILYTINQHELNANEEFVDNFGQVLYQAMKTSRY